MWDVIVLIPDQSLSIYFSEKQGRSTTIQDKYGKCLTEEKEILIRLTEFRSEIYYHKSYGDNAVLDCYQSPKE